MKCSLFITFISRMTLVINSNTPLDQDEISDNHITKIDGSNFHDKGAIRRFNICTELRIKPDGK